jgi:hypothetical protein
MNKAFHMQEWQLQVLGPDDCLQQMDETSCGVCVLEALRSFVCKRPLHAGQACMRAARLCWAHDLWNAAVPH